MLVIGVIVLGVAIYFLTFVTNFDSFFLSNNQKILSKYSTCALALCAYGYTSSGDASPEVNQIGCLERESGECILTCSQVREKVFSVEDVKSEIRGDRRVYCGEESKIEFEFSDLEFRNAVPLVSGQMDKISKPNWLCKPIKIGNIQLDDILGNVPFVNTADALYHGTDSCIMLAKLSEVPVTTIANLFQPDNERIAGGCFTGITFNTKVGIEQLYTPILEYKTLQQKVHPSGIYLDASDHFTDTTYFNVPECELENPHTVEFTVSDEDIGELVKKYKNQQFDQLIEGSCDNFGNNCEFIPVSFEALDPDDQQKVARSILKEEFGDIVFVDNINDCPSGKRCQQFGNTEIPDNSLGDRISKCNFQIRYRTDKITYSVYAEDTLPTPFAYFGSCKTVTLDRELNSNLFVESEIEIEVPEEIEDITIMVELPKSEYSVGETVTVSGTIKSDSTNRRFSSSEKVEVDFLNTRINFAVTDRVNVNDGKFEAEFDIAGEILKGATFKVSAKYKDTVSDSVEFLVN